MKTQIRITKEIFGIQPGAIVEVTTGLPNHWCMWTPGGGYFKIDSDHAEEIEPSGNSEQLPHRRPLKQPPAPIGCRSPEELAKLAEHEHEIETRLALKHGGLPPEAPAAAAPREFWLTRKSPKFGWAVNFKPFSPREGEGGYEEIHVREVGGFNHFCPGESGQGEWSHRSDVPSVCHYCKEPNEALLKQELSEAKAAAETWEKRAKDVELLISKAADAFRYESGRVDEANDNGALWQAKYQHAEAQLSALRSGIQEATRQFGDDTTHPARKVLTALLPAPEQDRQEIIEKDATATTFMNQVKGLQAELATLRADAGRMKELLSLVLTDFHTHSPGCHKASGDDLPCKCGLDQFIADVEAGLGGREAQQEQP